MPGPRRQSRLVALLLLLLTPGLGGWAVQALHPCPAALPPAASAAGSGHGQGHHEDAPGHSGHESECNCIGSCQPALAAQQGNAPTVDAPIPAFQLVQSWPAGTRPLAGQRTPRLHPPATAPPVLS